jgi:hypothetical protein
MTAPVLIGRHFSSLHDPHLNRKTANHYDQRFYSPLLYVDLVHDSLPRVPESPHVDSNPSCELLHGPLSLLTSVVDLHFLCNDLQNPCDL